MLKRVFKGFRPNWPALRDYRVRVGLYDEAEPLLRCSAADLREMRNDCCNGNIAHVLCNAIADCTDAGADLQQPATPTTRKHILPSAPMMDKV